MSHDLPKTGVGGNSPLPTTTDGIIPGVATNLVLTSCTRGPFGDEGGWKIELTGVFPLAFVYYVDILKIGDNTFDAQRCYSGVQGQGFYCRPNSTLKLEAWIPPLPIFDGYDVRVHSIDGLLSSELANAFDVIHRSYTTNLYEVRAHFPPPRAVGPYSIEDED